MVWYSHLFNNFPQFVVIHTVTGFGIVNKAEVDVFLEVICFVDDPTDVGNLIPGSSASLIPSWSTGEGNGNPPQYSCQENPMNKQYEKAKI